MFKRICTIASTRGVSVIPFKHHNKEHNGNNVSSCTNTGKLSKEQQHLYLIANSSGYMGTGEIVTKQQIINNKFLVDSHNVCVKPTNVKQPINIPGVVNSNGC